EYSISPALRWAPAVIERANGPGLAAATTATEAGRDSKTQKRPDLARHKAVGYMCVFGGRGQQQSGLASFEDARFVMLELWLGRKQRHQFCTDALHDG